MRFSKVAGYFDRTAIKDAYTGVLLFYGQMIAPAERVSGDTFRKHTLSTASTASAPARRVIDVLGDKWVMGNGNLDGFNGVAVRKNWSLKRATNSGQLHTPGELIDNVAGPTVYFFKEYFRDTVNVATTSDYDSYFDLYLPGTEPVLKGSWISDATGTFYRVRNVLDEPEGFMVAESDEFPSSILVSAEIEGTTFDAVLDQFTGSSTTVAGLLVDASKFYRNLTGDTPTHLANDRTLFVKNNVTVELSNKITIAGQTWSVMQKVSELDCWALLLRPV
jgi:hypothetical protein